jgi:hypothetical protein
MLAALLFGQASADGAQFFQAPVAGYVSRGSMMSQAVPVPMVPLAGNQFSFPFAEPVPYVVTEVRGEHTADESLTYALSFGVCALAVAGAVVHKSSMKKQRKMRLATPVMQLREQVVAPVGTSLVAGKAPAQTDASILVQGGSLRTWSYRSPAVEQVQVVLGTEGRPLDADIELWHGPDNTPVKMRVYCENGEQRPFSAVIETPRGPNTVAIRNIGQIEFPIAAEVLVENVVVPSADAHSFSTTVQGGALRTYPFDPTVDSVEVLIRTDGRPLNARIELLQGPNNNKQVIELYTEDGCDRPFFCILETPGAGNVIRIVNTSPVEFPMTAGVVPHSINQEMGSGAVLGGDVVIGGDVGW